MNFGATSIPSIDNLPGAAVVGAAVVGAAVVGAAVVGAAVIGAAVVGATVEGADVLGLLQVTLHPLAPIPLFLPLLMNSSNMLEDETNSNFFFFPQTLKRYGTQTS